MDTETRGNAPETSANEEVSQGKVQWDGWITALAGPDGDFQAGDIIVIWGFAGPSDEEGYVRLYQDLLLYRAIEVPEDAILYSVRGDAPPLGGSLVWLKKSEWSRCRWRVRTAAP